MSPIEEYPELEDNFMSEERELQEDGEEKEEEIPENANTEMISMQTLLQVFRGGNEVLDANRFASHQKLENIYLEVGWILSLKRQPIPTKISINFECMVVEFLLKCLNV